VSWSRAFKEHPEWVTEIGIEGNNMQQFYHYTSEIMRQRFPEVFEKRSAKMKATRAKHGVNPVRGKYKDRAAKAREVKAQRRELKKLSMHGEKAVNDALMALPPAASTGPEPAISGMFCPRCTALIESIERIAHLLKGGKPNKPSIVPFSNMLPRNE